MGGYDIIGDVHGCATALEELLDILGYRESTSSGAYEHLERQAVFVGDLVDRGPGQLDVLQIAKRMTDSGSAQIVMGNHEFNAIAYDTPHPDRSGEFLRPRTAKNTKQHHAFLDQVDTDARAEHLEWFMTLPLWLELGGLRIVHACWHDPSMRVVREVLGSDRFTSRDQFIRATEKGDPLYEAIEVLLKGPEIDLAAHGQPPYYDKDGHARTKARVAWWRDGATTLRDLSVMDKGFVTETGKPYPTLPDIEVAESERSFAYRGDVPVFYGHYWRSGHPRVGVDFTARTACVDFSAINSGKLAAYRWDGESEIREDHYVNVTERSRVGGGRYIAAMTAKRRSRSSGGSSGGGAALFGVLLVLGLIVKFFWWILAAAVAVSLVFAVRALVRRLQERRDAAAREAEEIAYRADRQNRMAQRGDARGVYGVAGAELMRDISIEPPTLPSDEPAEGVTIAGLADTAAELTQLLADKPPGWRWAAFASVLVQRRAAVRSRVRDVRLGYATPVGTYAPSGVEVARFVTGCMDDLVKLVGQTEAFMLTPAFMEVFGQHGDESTADAEGIVQVANRLMDYHERFLTFAECCCDFDAPSRYSGLMHDGRQLMNVPLDSYDTFIDDFADFIVRMPDLMRHGRGTVENEPISLHMTVDDQLMKRVTTQIRAAAKSRA